MAKDYAMQVTKEMASARTEMRVSGRAAQSICGSINRLQFPKAMEFVEKLVEKEASIGGKYHDEAAKEVLRLLKGLESNAKNRNMDTEKMTLNISVHNGPKMLRGRRNRHFGMRLKNTKVQAVLIPKTQAPKSPTATSVKEEKKEK